MACSVVRVGVTLGPYIKTRDALACSRLLLTLLAIPSLLTASYPSHVSRFGDLTTYLYERQQARSISKNIDPIPSNDISATPTNMSCDFGPIPIPKSPMETYWEHQFRSGSSSRSAPVTQPEKKDIAPQLHTALEKLAVDQSTNLRKLEPNGAPLAHRRGKSIGERLLSEGMEFWGVMKGDPVVGGKVKRS